jgi:hypothetical protein
MNLKSVYAHAADKYALPRPQKTLVCPDHELIALAYEEALKRGWDANYGTAYGSAEHFLEVFDCSLDEFASILQAADAKRKATAEIFTTRDKVLVAAGGDA